MTPHSIPYIPDFGLHTTPHRGTSEANGMTEDQKKGLAELLDEAARHGETIPQITSEVEGLDVETAYDIQRLSIARRTDRGEWRVGMKMGLTSRAKMEQVGVHEPIYGHLTDAMAVPDGGTISMSGRCHPRAEPEIAFVMGEDLQGEATDAEAIAAVRGVTAALEIIDSRYRNFSFTLPDVVADNTSASGFVLGSTLRPPADVNLGNLGIVLEVNGKVVETGSSAAIYDHPVRSLVELLRMLARRGEGLRRGDVVLAGAATAAVHLNAGDHIRAVVDELGTAEFFVTGGEE